MTSSIELLMEVQARIAATKENDFTGVAALYSLLDLHAQIVRNHVNRHAFNELLS